MNVKQQTPAEGGRDSIASSTPLFGRAPDLALLTDRVKHQGLTVVSGRPQIGKSHLLRKLGDNLHDAGSLVGYAESTAETADLFLRALSNLYSRWLTTARYRDQARVVLSKRNHVLIGIVGEVVTQIIGKVVTLGQITPPVVGDIVQSGFASLLNFGKDMRTGGLELPRLSYDDARDLVMVLATLTDSRICIMLDGLDQSPALERELGLLTAYLRHLDEWPGACHVFVGVRDDAETASAMKQVRDMTSSSGAASIHALERMRLTEDTAEKQRVLNYIRDNLPFTAATPDQSIIVLLDGYPGALQRWIQGRPGSERELADLALDAQAYRYRDLDAKLSDVVVRSAELRTIAIRLALLPELRSADAWHFFRSIVLQDLADDLLLDLQSSGILEDEGFEWPTYGHSKRYEAVHHWFVTKHSDINPRPYSRHEAAYLVLATAGHCTAFDVGSWPFLQALGSMLSTARLVGLEDRLTALCIAAKSMSPVPLEAADKQDLRKAAKLAIDVLPSAAWLIEAGLLNAAVTEGETGMGQALQDLLDIHGTETIEFSLGKIYATWRHGGLGQSGPAGPVDTGREDVVMNALRERLRDAPDDEQIRLLLAKAVYEAFMHSMRSGDRERTRALKTEALGLIRGQSIDSDVFGTLMMITETDMGW